MLQTSFSSLSIGFTSTESMDNANMLAGVAPIVSKQQSYFARCNLSCKPEARHALSKPNAGMVRNLAQIVILKHVSAQTHAKKKGKALLESCS